MISTEERMISRQVGLDEQMQVLVDAARNHETRIARQDALIERLDVILERLVYREGRNGYSDPL
jgi:hypothetical protein